VTGAKDDHEDFMALLLMVSGKDIEIDGHRDHTDRRADFMNAGAKLNGVKKVDGVLGGVPIEFVVIGAERPLGGREQEV
jgi:hypothetical protein